MDGEGDGMDWEGEEYIKANERTCQRMLKFLGQNWTIYLTMSIAPTKTQREQKKSY